MPDTKQQIPSEPPPSYDVVSKSPPGGTGAPGPPRPPGGPRPILPLNIPALSYLKGKRVILASASPRRKMLLAQIGLTDLECLPSNHPEDLPKTLSPHEYALRTATAKATSTYAREIDNTTAGEPALIIAADTVVVAHFGEILEKPRSEKHHIQMLTLLRDSGPHTVVTGVAVMAPLESAVEPGYRLETHVEETVVRFDPNLSDELILAYVRTREGADKAGGYGIQGIGSILVDKIEGTFDNVVGLPVKATLALIEKALKEDEEEQLEDEGKPSLFSNFWSAST